MVCAGALDVIISPVGIPACWNLVVNLALVDPSLPVLWILTADITVGFTAFFFLKYC
jgi:hypothetical protein